jgi:predicted Ser/Thr protein kinase
MILQSGARIRDYTVVEKLRPGGMGSVYKVTRAGGPGFWALKVLHEHACDDDRQRFENEARVLEGLDHRNIAKVHDYFEEGGRQYLLMEYIDGMDLDEIVRSGRIPLTHAIDYVSQLLLALEAIRAAGVIHRDIKPSNIRIAPDECVKLLDFGLAHHHGAERLTQKREVLVTPLYSSPEQDRGLEPDHRSDLYSTGVLLYELITGEPPIPRTATDEQVMRRKQDSDPPDPRSKAPALPDRLSGVVLRAVKRNPAERYATAEEFRQALMSAMDTESTRKSQRAAPQDQPTRRSNIPAGERAPRRRHPKRAIGFLAAVFAVCAVCAGAYFFLPVKAQTFLGVNSWRLVKVWQQPHELRNNATFIAPLKDGRVILVDGYALSWVELDGHVRSDSSLYGLTALVGGPEGQAYGAVMKDYYPTKQSLVQELREPKGPGEEAPRAIGEFSGEVRNLLLSPDGILFARTDDAIHKIYLQYKDMKVSVPYSRGIIWWRKSGLRLATKCCRIAKTPLPWLMK